MKYIDHKENIRKYSIHQNIVIYNDDFIGSIIKKGKCKIDFAMNIIPFVKNQPIISDDRNYPYVIENDKAIKILGNYRINCYSNKYLCLYIRESNIYGIYSIQNEKLLYDNQSYLGSHILGDIIFSGYGYSEEIVARYIPDYKILSRFKLSELGSYKDGAEEKALQVMEFSGIYEDILICTLNNGGILLFNFQTGQVELYYEDARVRLNVNNKENGSPIFWGLNHNTFIEIDVEKRKIIKQVNIDSLLRTIKNIPKESPNWIFVNTSIVYNNLIYFIADKDILGVFDPTTAEIVDCHTIAFDKKGIFLKRGKENFQVKDNRIYCIDTSDTLHILERD